MRHSDYILSHGAGALAASTDGAFIEEFTVCITIDTPDDLLFALLDILKDSFYIHAIYLYLRRPGTAGARRLESYLFEAGKKFTLITYGDEYGEADALARGDEKRMPCAAAMNRMASRAETRRLLFLEPRIGLDNNAIHRLYDAMITSDYSESGIFFPNIQDIKPRALFTPEYLLIRYGLGLSRSGMIGRIICGKRSRYGKSLAERASLPLYSFAVSQSFFWRIGGFDGELTKGAALEDFCLSVCETGGEIVKSPRASMLYYKPHEPTHRQIFPYPFKDILRIFNKHFRGMYRPGVQMIAYTLTFLRSPFRKKT